MTELIDGGTLRDWGASPRTWRQIIDLLVGVADALAAAHQAGILHRDIKPENVFVTQSGYAKLADFGLARLDAPAPQDDAQTLSVRTRAGLIVGTVAYMSPEQAMGRALDARSDIFSFGVLLYELFTGHRPFEGDTTVDLLHAIAHAPPRSIDVSIPLALKLVVDKALEKDPADRYQTMRELVVDMRRLARRRSAA